MTRLETLLARWEAGELTAAEAAELKGLLADPAARADLVEDWLLTSTIHDAFHTAAATAAPAPAPTAPVAKPARPRRFRWLVWREVRLSFAQLGAAGAAASLALAGVWFYFQQAAVATLTDVKGAVVIHRQGAGQTATNGTSLRPGDLITVAADGSASLKWAGEETSLVLAPGTRLEARSPLFGKRFLLRDGSLEAAVAPQAHLRPMILSTPEAEARVVGTRFSLTATNRLSRLAVLEGAVRFRPTHPSPARGAGELLVAAGHAASLSPDAPSQLNWVTGFLAQDAWTVPAETPLRDAPKLGVPLTTPAAAGSSAAGSIVVERLRGYLLAPTIGNYVFWVASQGGGAPVELWLSPDEDPKGSERIAYAAAASNTPPPSRPTSLQVDFLRSPTQQSTARELEKGRRYYLEVWHSGQDLRTLGIGWRPPGRPAESQPELIAKDALCPFIESTAHPAARAQTP